MSKIKGEQNHITEERYLFYQSLCAWSKKLYLTYPRGDEKMEFVQSDFLREFLNTFEVRESTGSDFENKIYTHEQLLTYIGKNGIQKAESLSGSYEAGINKAAIKTALEIDKFRTDSPFGDSGYTGNISASLSDEGKRNLELTRDKQFSISQLETYALCPYRYFAERVLKLDIIEEPSEEIEALEMGSLLHSILFTFYSSLKKDNVVLNNCTNEEFNRAADLLFKIADEKIKGANFNSPLSFYERENIRNRRE